MHKYLNEYEKAYPALEKDAMNLFPYKSMTPEEYAAREGHNWGCFSFGSYIYENSEFNEWIHTLDDIFFSKNGIKHAREKYLTKEEIAEIGSSSLS